MLRDIGAGTMSAMRMLGVGERLVASCVLRRSEGSVRFSSSTVIGSGRLASNSEWWQRLIGSQVVRSSHIAE